jgi:hypothetical protein
MAWDSTKSAPSAQQPSHRRNAPSTVGIAQARVEFGDAPVFMDATQLALCVPTSWSDTMIHCTAHLGALKAGTAYAFVFDGNGSVRG